MKNTYPLNNILPGEISKKIEDMACMRMVNGAEKSNELLLKFELNKNAKSVHDELIKWLLDCLDTISHKVEECGQYGWNIVSQIMHNDWEDENPPPNCETIRNAIMVAIHISDSGNSYNDEHELTIPSHNDCLQRKLSPQELLDCLVSEPQFVFKIGVSAVSEETIQYYWADMISTEANMFDCDGKGPMLHRMWMKMPDGCWLTIREKSFNFGWKR